MAEESLHPNVQRLVEARLINLEQARKNEKEFKKLEDLCDCEITILICLQEKLGGGTITQPDTSAF